MLKAGGGSVEATIAALDRLQASGQRFANPEILIAAIAASTNAAANSAAAVAAVSAAVSAANPNATLTKESDRALVRSIVADPKRGLTSLGPLSDDQIDRMLKAGGGSVEATIAASDRLQASGQRFANLEALIAAIAASTNAAANSAAAVAAVSAANPNATLTKESDRALVRSIVADPKRGLTSLGPLSDDQIDRMLKAGGGSVEATIAALDRLQASGQRFANPEALIAAIAASTNAAANSAAAVAAVSAANPNEPSPKNRIEH